MCAKKQGLAAGSRRWLAVASRQIDAHVPSMPEAEAPRQLFTIGPKSQAGQAVCSQLELATQPSREVKLPEYPVWQKYDFSYSFSPYYIYNLIPTIQRELLERILREKPKRKQD